MRIAYFVNRYPAISHTFIRREIRAMEAHGFSIARFALQPDPHLVDEADHAEAKQTRFVLNAGVGAFARALALAAITRPLTFVAVFCQALKMGWRSESGLARHIAYVVEGALLADWCQGDGVQHIHAHFGTNSAAVALFASRLSGIPFSFTAHGPEEFDNGPMLSLAEKLRFASFAVCVSAFGRVQLMRLSSPDLWPKIKIVHCGLDEAFLGGDAMDCPDANRFVCVGRLCAEKAQNVLIAAAKNLAKSGEPFEIVLAGDGPTRASLEDAIADAGLKDSIRMIGRVSGAEVRSELLAARAFILPSFSENMPVVIMEAMALKRPVISTFVAGIPELVEPGKSGWLVPAGDEAALANAMREALAAPPARLNAMGAAGRAHVLEQHDAFKEAGKLKVLIEAAAVLRVGTAAPPSRVVQDTMSVGANGGGA
jgi:glycosyltransferase involved in cell wall biosynthesis